MAVQFAKDDSSVRCKVISNMSKQYYSQHIVQAIRYIILTYVGALVVGACVGDGITGELVRVSVVGSSVDNTVGTMVGFFEGLAVTGLSPGDTVGSDVVGLDATGLRLGDLDGLEVSGFSPQLAQNGPPTSCTGLV